MPYQMHWYKELPSDYDPSSVKSVKVDAAFEVLYNIRMSLTIDSAEELKLRRFIRLWR